MKGLSASYWVLALLHATENWGHICNFSFLKTEIVMRERKLCDKYASSASLGHLSLLVSNKAFKLPGTM